MKSNREELERAIEHIADNVKFLQTHHNADNSLEAHELALTALKEKLEREKNPLTWNERINQMTVEEKARWMLNRGTEMHIESAKYAWDNASRKFEEMYIQRMIEFLASPYTEGETDEG